MPRQWIADVELTGMQIRAKNDNYMLFVSMPDRQKQQAAVVFQPMALIRTAHRRTICGCVRVLRSKCCNVTYFLCEYIVFCLCRLLCAACMNFEYLYWNMVEVR